MLGFIRGKVLSTFKIGKSVSNLVIWPYENDEALGVAYTVTVAEQSAMNYPKDSVVSLWLYQVHNENDSYLIGLESAQAMNQFIDLLSVSGVGPRTALTVIGALGIEGLQEAILMRDVKALTKAPGLGQKTAAKIIIELGGKEGSASAVAATKQIGKQSNSKYGALTATLQKLGYTAQQAREAVEKAIPNIEEKGVIDVAEQVKMALAYLG